MLTCSMLFDTLVIIHLCFPKCVFPMTKRTGTPSLHISSSLYIDFRGFIPRNAESFIVSDISSFSGPWNSISGRPFIRLCTEVRAPTE